MKQTLICLSILFVSSYAFGQCTNLRRCVGDEITLLAEPPVTADTYTWSTGASLNSLTEINETSDTYNATVESDTVYYQVSAGENSVCWSIVPVTVAITGDVTPCANESTQITAEITECSFCTFVWSGEILTEDVIGNTLNFPAQPSSDSPYELTLLSTFVDGDYTCESSQLIPIEVSDLPTVTIVGNPMACLNSPTNYSAITNATTIEWSNTSDSNTASYTFNTAGANVISVNVTDNNNCVNSASLTVMVNELPIVSIEGANSACLNAVNSYTVETGAETILWSNGASSTTTSYTFNSENNQIVTVTVTDANSCNNTASLEVMINPLPSVSIEGESSVCLNSINSYSLQTESEGLSVQWSNASSSATASFAFNAIGTTTISVTVTDENSCVGDNNLEITVNPLPVVTISGDASPCLNDVVTYIATPAASTYEWSNGTTAPSADYTFSMEESMTIAVSVIDVNGCEGNDSLEVQVLPLPEFTLDGESLLCGASTQFELTASPSSLEYIWALQDTSGVLETLSSSNELLFDNGYGTFTLLITGTDDNECQSQESLSISSISGPPSPIDNDINICENSPLVLEGTEGYEHEWIVFDLSIPIDTSISIDTSFALGIGVYQLVVTLIDPNQESCVTTDTATVTVHTNPTFTVNYSPITCVAQPFEISVSEVIQDNLSVTNYATSWALSTGDNSEENPLIDTVFVAGSYTATVVVTESLYNCASENTVSFAINAGPQFVHTPPAPACFGESVLLAIDTVFASSFTISWEDEEVLYNNDSFYLTLNDSSNVYTVIVSDEITGCVSDSTYSVQSIPLPELISLQLLTNGLLSAQSSIDYSFTWGYTSAATGIEIVHSSNDDYAYFDNFDPANNYYWVEYSNSSGCIQRAYFNAPPTNVQEDALAHSFTAYPIPANQTLTLESTQLTYGAAFTYQIVSSMGKLIQHSETSAGNNRVTLDVTALSQGLYYLRFITDSHIHVIPFTKQ